MEKVDIYSKLHLSMLLCPILDFTKKIFIQNISSFSNLAGQKWTAYTRGFWNKGMVITSNSGVQIFDRTTFSIWKYISHWISLILISQRKLYKKIPVIIQVLLPNQKNYFAGLWLDNCDYLIRYTLILKIGKNK